MLDATFDRPDLTTCTGVDGLGLTVVGQRLEPSSAVLACHLVSTAQQREADRWCRRCGCIGRRPRGNVIRRLAHEPFGWRPTVLAVRVARYACTGCTHIWRQDTTAAAPPRATLSRAALRWALHALVVQHLTVARVAEALAVSCPCSSADATPWRVGEGPLHKAARCWPSLHRRCRQDKPSEH